VSVLAVVLLFGTLDLGAIVAAQTHTWAGWLPAWNVFLHPVAFLLFLICIHAEANRAPFDLAEAEQELVGGYHTEYSSMRFALFFLAEYAGMITTSAVCVALFFGGWHLPFGLLDGNVIAGNPIVTDNLLICILRTAVFFAKTVLILFIFMWVRWSLPRFRFDQLMMLAWRALIPISLALLMMTALVVYFWGTNPRTLINGTMIVPGKMALWMLLGNGLVVVGALIGSQFFPDAPETNRRMKVPGSRFSNKTLPTASASV
jgi:NADH-quinone oxidoreductase subunit H